MKTVDNIFFQKYEIKKSTFLSYLIPSKSFDAFRKELKKDHPKSVHIVWAKREFNEFYQIVENSSDDGEPKGTSGPPVLNVLRGAQLINCAVLIVRYFGGIKLGTGGLVRAYSASANLAINEAKLIDFEIKKIISFCMPYSMVQRLEYIFDKINVSEITREFKANKVNWKANLTQNEKTLFLDFINQQNIENFTYKTEENQN